MNVSTSRAFMLMIGALPLALSACSQTSGSNETNGAVLGAVAGSVVGGMIGGNSGNGVAGAIAGAAIGGILGAGVGAYLDEQDRAQLAAMSMATAETGQVKRFYNPNTKVRLTTTRKPPSAQTAANCRVVEQVAMLADGTEHTDSSTMCKTANGWVTS